MRRLIVLGLAAALIGLPVTAAFAVPLGSDDGTLSVRHGRGVVKLAFKGAVFGRVAKGVVRINDPVDGDGQGADFFGCEVRHDTDTTTVCSGDDIRFRAIGGRYAVKVAGSGIFVSAVGRGKVLLDGNGDDTGNADGGYSFNGNDYQSLPDDPTPFALAAPRS
jgi:hypothetical protein